MLVILLGAPGVGKGTQAELLAKDYNLVTLSTGEILRNAVRRKAKLGIQVREVMSSGGLVSDDMVCPLVKNELKQKTNHNGYILDGFPRTIYQAHILDDIVITSYFEKSYIVSLSLEEEEIVKRLSARIFCKNCNQGYNSITKKSKTKGKCDVCGHVYFYTRKDDKKSTIKVRLSAYIAQTSLLIEYYKTYENYIDIDASQDIEKIHKEIVSFIEKHKT